MNRFGLLGLSLVACQSTSREAAPSPQPSASLTAAAALHQTAPAESIRVEATRVAPLPVSNVRSYTVEPIDVVEVRSEDGALRVFGVRPGDAQVTMVARDGQSRAFVVHVEPATGLAPLADTPSPTPTPKPAPPRKPHGYPPAPFSEGTGF